MCHERWFRREQRDQRFEEELRYLFDRETEQKEPPTPVVEHEPATDAAEREADQAPVASP